MRVALLVDPADQSILLFRPHETLLAVCGDDRIDLNELLPGFVLSVAQLFGCLDFR